MKKLCVLLLILMFSVTLFSAENPSKISFNKPTIRDNVWVNANRMNGVYRNDGIWLYDFGVYVPSEDCGKNRLHYWNSGAHSDL